MAVRPRSYYRRRYKSELKFIRPRITRMKRIFNNHELHKLHEYSALGERDDASRGLDNLRLAILKVNFQSGRPQIVQRRTAEAACLSRSSPPQTLLSIQESSIIFMDEIIHIMQIYFSGDRFRS